MLSDNLFDLGGCQRDAAEAAGLSIEELVKIEPTLGLKILPHWLAQPYFRPLPPADTSKPSDRVDAESVNTNQAIPRCTIP